jgi:uncharacterized protein YjdB
MFVRCARGLWLLCFFAVLAGCANPSGLDSIQVAPGSQALTVGQKAQFTASGTFGNAKHPTTQDVTSSVTWTSSTPSVATVSSSGLATAVGAGTTTITANATAYNGPVSSSGTLTVTGTGGTTTGGTIASIQVIPGSQSVSSPSQTAQFIAIGTTSSGATVNLTSQVAWTSSSPQIATIGATTGIATALSKGTDTITALYTNSGSGSVVTGVASLTVAAGTTQQYTAVAITPSAQTLSASGQTGQLIALGTSGSTGLQQDVTGSSQIKWSSSSPSIATVNSSGLVTGVGAGSTTITAVITNSDGSVVSSSAAVTVSITAAPEPLLSLSIIPASITVGNLQDTGQFLAIGTFSTPPVVRDLTNSPTLTWTSSAPNVFPVSTNSAGASGSSAGTVTAYGSGSATVIAQAKSTDGSIQTAIATFNCPLVLPNPPSTAGSCYPGSQAASLIATLTVYAQGLNTTGWLLTAPSGTGTPNAIHCGPASTSGGSVCEGAYPIGTTVTITAPAESGVAFGGWSYNCTPTGPVTAAGPNSCTVTLSTNDSVAGIFN